MIGPGEVKKKKGQSLSKVEMERQKILEEMKKKTPLLTDSSWIRQRSSSNSVHKEPIYLGIPLKRWVYCGLAKRGSLALSAVAFIFSSHLSLVTLFSLQG